MYKSVGTCCSKAVHTTLTTRIRRCKMKNTVAESHEILLPHVVAWIKKDCLTSSINDWILGLYVHVDVYMYVPVPGAAPS